MPTRNYQRINHDELNLKQSFDSPDLCTGRTYVWSFGSVYEDFFFKKGKSQTSNWFAVKESKNLEWRRCQYDSTYETIFLFASKSTEWNQLGLRWIAIHLHLF